MWLEKGELESIQETEELDYTQDLEKIPDFIGNAYKMARQEKHSEIRCPKCEKLMEKREYGYCSQVIIDICPSCKGIWLDKGETKALEIFFERAKGKTQGIRRTFFKSLTSLFDKS